MSDNTIPKIAEQIDLWKVLHSRRVPSKFAPPAEAVEVRLECPACHFLHEYPGWDATVRCNCGLSMRSTAQGFFIWRDDAPQAAE